MRVSATCVVTSTQAYNSRDLAEPFGIPAPGDDLHEASALYRLEGLSRPDSISACQGDFNLCSNGASWHSFCQMAALADRLRTFHENLA